MLNQSADYALRAVLYLAQQPRGHRSSAETISSAIGVPRNYLGKVLNTLARVRVLSSVRGPRGGFRLARDPGEITLLDVIEPFQRLPERRVCLLGNRPCDAARPCSVHVRWRRVAEPVNTFFRETTVERLLAPEHAPTYAPIDTPQPATLAEAALAGSAAGGAHREADLYEY